MTDRLKAIPNQILEWFKKFSTKQRMLLISLAAVVVIALGILYVVLSRPTKVLLKEAESTKQAAEIQNLLEEAALDYSVTDNGLIFSVNKKDLANANILLGENSIVTAPYDLNSVFSGGFSATEADKNKKYQLYLEEKLESDLKLYDQVKEAAVNLYIPEDDSSVASLKKEEISASITLELLQDISPEIAEGLARFIATSLGNKSTNNIAILDTAGNPLFTGGEEDTAAGVQKKNLSLKKQYETDIRNQVREVLLDSDLYQSVNVGVNLEMDYTQKKSTVHERYNAEGGEGPITRENTYENETTGGIIGVPGTDPNDDDNTQVLQDDTNASSSTTETDIDRAIDESINETTDTGGTLVKDQSSITVVVNQHTTYNEDFLRSDGQLEGMTFDQYKEQNDDPAAIQVPEEVVQMVANATGIPVENITIVGRELPFFEYSSGADRDIFDYIPIALAVIIMLLLGYVVFRSTRRETVGQLEPELSVENLLETTKMAHQDELENIGFSEKSETRILIEKFVDENPEAAAALLRNWLNEEWE